MKSKVVMHGFDIVHCGYGTQSVMVVRPHESSKNGKNTSQTQDRRKPKEPDSESNRFGPIQGKIQIG